MPVRSLHCASPKSVRRLIVVGLLLICGTAVAAWQWDLRLPPPRDSKVTSQNTPQNRPSDAAPYVINQARSRWDLNRADARFAKEYAAALESGGKTEDAVGVLLASIEKTPRSADLYHAIGALYLRHEYFSYAADAFHNELVIKPDNTVGLIQYGATLAQMNRKDEAVAAFKRAHELNPNDPEPMLGLAFSLNNQDQATEAIAWARKYINRAKNPGGGYALLSRIYINKEQHDKAAEAGRRAVELLPGNPGAWYNLGQAYLYRRGTPDLTRAEDAFRRSVSLNPHNSTAHYELGYTLQREGRIEDAINVYRESLRQDPNRAKTYTQLYVLLQRVGRKVEAAEALARAKRLIADNQRENQLLTKHQKMIPDPKPLFELGMLYKRQGNYGRAIAAFRGVLDREPGSRRAHEQLADVYSLGGDSPRAASERRLLGQ